MKRKIHFWMWSTMPICIVWRRSGFGRSLTIYSLCRNTLNPRWTWYDKSSASAALVVALLSVRYRLWSPWGVAWHEGYNLQLCSLDTHTNYRHVARDDVGRYTQRNPQAMLLKLGCNAWSCHLHRERCNTCSRRWDFVSRWEAGIPVGVPCSAPLGLFAAAHPVASEDYCSPWQELAGDRPFRRCALRASGGSSKIDCQLSYILATLSCCQQNSSELFHRTWRSTEPVHPPLWALTQSPSACHHPRVSLLTCVSHHHSTVRILV